MNLSIIIPAYNDAPVLKKCLECLAVQNTKESFEVIVVDDGSTDNTKDLVKSFPSVKYIFQENKKQGAARNRGVEEAQSDLIAFIGADILVDKNWVKEVLEFHRNFADEKNIGVGHIQFTPKIQQDRFCKWLENTALMPNFKNLKNYQEIDFWHFYTGNISMKKSFFQQVKFDKSFTAYGWEDTALGYELSKKGGKIFYLENAKCLHDHFLKFEDYFPDRMKEIGKSAKVFQEKYPEVQLIPQGFKKFVFQVLSLFFVVVILKFIKLEWYWYVLSKKYFLEAIIK